MKILYSWERNNDPKKWFNPPTKKLGRPVGTTKENGYKVSPGRPVSVIKDWDSFEKKFFQGLNNLK